MKWINLSFLSPGEHSGYGNLPNGGSGGSSSVYSALPPPPPVLQSQQPSASSFTSPRPLRPNAQSPVVEGPLCASSPKRSMSAFTTFGQDQKQRASSEEATPPPPMAPIPSASSKSTPVPTTGHLVWGPSFSHEYQLKISNNRYYQRKKEAQFLYQFNSSSSLHFTPAVCCRTNKNITITYY